MRKTPRTRADDSRRRAALARGPRTLAVEDSDETLVVQVGAGNRDAASKIIRRHLGPIVAFAGRTLGDRTEAEDIAQEVFLRLWIHAGRWRFGHLPTWLYRVALNLCLDRIAQRRTRPLDEAPEPVDPKPSVAARLQQQDIGRYVNRELMKLPVQQRIAITLCHYQGLRNAEAADTMDISIEALESLLARGRRTLRTRLRGVVPGLLGEG